ncbi:hypothetical protein JCM33374_g580 [Metschnikowia sp. JCM 33374]|nr:hypothetical protein JCM33374_g580 [Metschnikowia sp. JCM 33374]
MSSTAKQFQAKIFKNDALENSDSHPVFLTKVEVNGGDNMSRQFFSKLLSPLVEKSDYTLGQLVSKVDESSENLERTDVFEKISPSLHVDYTHSAPEKKSYNKENPLVTKVIFDLESKELSTGNLDLGFNNEDNLIVDLGYINNNFNHNAELVKIGVNYRPYKPFEHLVSGVRLESNLRNPTFKFVLDLYNSHENNQTWQQSSSKCAGGLIGISYLNHRNTISVFNGLSLVKRTIYDFGDGASDILKSFGGDFLKSSIISSFSYNSTLKSNGYINDGLQLSLKNQISSDQEQGNPINNQFGFIKTSGSFDFYKSFFNNAVTTHIFKEAGSIFTGGSSKEVHVSDKFYLGGFDNFKGFARNSVNEKGGFQFYKAGATVYGKVPSFLHPNLNPETNPMRLYVTGMTGNVGNNIFNESSVFSLGVGLRYIHQFVKLDVGYYLSKRASGESNYGVRDGFQLEISLGGAGRAK